MGIERKLSRTLSTGDVERMEAEIAQRESDLGASKKELPPADVGQGFAPANLPGASVDEAKARMQIAQQRAVLDAGNPANDKFTGNERDTAYQEAREHAEWLEKNMLTQKEMEMFPKDAYDYSRAVRKSQAQEVGSRDFQFHANRYRELMRRLDPDNPEAHSIEALRSRT